MRGIVVLVSLLASAVCAAESVAGSHGASRYAYVSADRIEFQSDVERSVWDLQGWYGGDLHKLVWKFEGSNGDDTEHEVQLLYGRAVSPYFDAQFGIRVADEPTGTDSALVVGVQGLAPYNIEVDVAAIVDSDGDVELQGEFEHDIRFTERVVLQPRLELRAASADAEHAALELRLRYELSRRVAPYIGMSWQRQFDESVADDTSTAFIAGLKFWF